MFGPVLRGQHVTLRPADDSDPPRMVPWFADMEVTRYLGRRMAVALYYEVEILKKFGWDIEDLGGVEAARAIEPLCILWCIPGFIRGQWGHAYKVLRA